MKWSVILDQIQEILTTHKSHAVSSGDEWLLNDGLKYIEDVLNKCTPVWEITNWCDGIENKVIINVPLSPYNDNSEDIARWIFNFIIYDFIAMTGCYEESGDTPLSDQYRHFNDIIDYGFDWILVPIGYDNKIEFVKYPFMDVDLYAANTQNRIIFGSRKAYSFLPIKFDRVNINDSVHLEMTFTKLFAHPSLIGKSKVGQ